MRTAMQQQILEDMDNMMAKWLDNYIFNRCDRDFSLGHILSIASSMRLVDYSITTMGSDLFDPVKGLISRR